MKALTFILLLCFFVSCVHTRDIKQIDSLETSKLYRISKIKHEKSFFVIYAERNDSTFKIVSSKNEETSKCKKIKFNRKYNLELRKIFPMDSLFGFALAPNHAIVFTMGKEEKIVHREKKSHFWIYCADNLNGLCIQE